ncbi:MULTISPECIES: alpha/beta hydrolase [Streptomyces]|uniref:Alpha/beta fold hydrolase n=2 Tax=Streptomyces TaxID=1883 RepID=A0ABP3NKA8_9ACTN|nr:alpha/beta hydrolase [Streptomyces sp. WAC05858]RSS34620.1 alpha/beta hydrolase [Streptomyces sp. WAC05858]WTA83906.1 alpha/beta hydrolase [Streptomyces antimycoticus]WTB05664.1 alpha/beta hydrolase [Streptomyces antimycoticus]
MSRPLRLGALSTALLLAVLAAGCGGGGGRPDTSARQKLDWSSCPAPSPDQDAAATKAPGGQWECATLHAPLDYRKPHGRTIGIAMIRAKATDRRHRIGSLIFNFGGPGGSGVATLPALANSYKQLRTRYDLVSFDPRGVGRSSGVRCLGDRQLDAYYAADSTPDNKAEVKSQLRRVKIYAAACEKNSGPVLPYVGTTNAARDMDLMRSVLGDKRMHYFGVSYGTELGGVYAHLFPKKVGRALFDGVVDPMQTPEQGALAQAKGFQRALNDYLKACTKTTVSSCPTQPRIRTLLKRLDGRPVRGYGGRKLTESLADGGIAQSLYSRDYWQYLTQGIAGAQQGDGRILLALGDALNGRGPDGRYSTLQSALTAITCADFKQRYTVPDIERKLPAFRKVSPVFGDMMAWGLTQCTDWPVRGAWSTPDVSAKGAAPILVVGNTGDPATPYEGAGRMAKELGPGVGVELTYKGEGHGAYDGGNACVRKTVNAYLLQGKVPEKGKVCG